MNRELAPPPSHIRTSFVEPLNNTDNSRFTQWPNFTFQGENKNGNDRQSVRSSIAASTTGILFPAQNVIKQKSGLFIRVKGMCTTFPVRDMSWATGVLFTIGSAVFVINGFFLLLPLVAPQTNFKNETPYATPASSMLGTIIFILGGWTGFLEGMNLKRGEVLEVTEGIEVEVLQVSRRDRKMDEEQGSINSKSNNISWPLGNPLHQTTPLGMPSSSSSPPPSMSPPPHIALLGSSRFIWWPSAQQYRVYYRRDLIFSAGFVQFIGTFIFAIASITAVPGVISFENILLVDLSNLGPATLGGLFFLTAAMCQILNAQERWYVPRPTTLDWQIGFWNAVGSLGFTLAGALPYIGTTNATLQATLADFWGSWAFLIGSLLQWYSSLGNYC